MPPPPPPTWISSQQPAPFVPTRGDPLGDGGWDFGLFAPQPPSAPPAPRTSRPPQGLPQEQGSKPYARPRPAPPSSASLQHQAEWALHQHESMLSRLVLEAQCSVQAQQAQQDKAQIAQLEAEREGHVKTISALEQALAEARRQAAAREAAAGERERLQEQQAAALARSLADAEQLPALRAQLRDQSHAFEEQARQRAIEYERLVASHAALQAEAEAAQRRLQEAAQQLEQQQSRHLIEMQEQGAEAERRLKEAEEEHQEQVLRLRRKTASLIVAAAPEAAEGEQRDVEAQVLSLLSQLYADELSEEAAAQQLAALNCSLSIGGGGSRGPEAQQGEGQQGEGQQQQELGSVGGSQGLGSESVGREAAAAELPSAGQLSTDSDEPRATVQGLAAIAAGPDGTGAAPPASPAATAPTAAAAAPSPSAWSFQTRFVMAEPERLVRLITRAAQIKGSSSSAGPAEGALVGSTAAAAVGGGAPTEGLSSLGWLGAWRSGVGMGSSSSGGGGGSAGGVAAPEAGLGRLPAWGSAARMNVLEATAAAAGGGGGALTTGSAITESSNTIPAPAPAAVAAPPAPAEQAPANKKASGARPTFTISMAQGKAAQTTVPGGAAARGNDALRTLAGDLLAGLAASDASGGAGGDGGLLRDQRAVPAPVSAGTGAGAPARLKGSSRSSSSQGGRGVAGMDEEADGFACLDLAPAPRR